MSKLKEAIQKLQEEQKQALSETCQDINPKFEEFKARGKAIREELKQTKYPLRIKELEAQRDKLLEDARAFYQEKYNVQKNIIKAISAKYDALIALSNEDVLDVDLLNMELPSHRLQLAKDIVMSSTSDELTLIIEDLAMDKNNKEVMALIRMYAKLRAKKELDRAEAKIVSGMNYEGAESLNREGYIAFTDIANIDKIKAKLNKLKPLGHGLYISPYQTEAEVSFLRQVYDTHPYANAWG